MTTLPSDAPLLVTVIDDDAIFRAGLCSWLESQGVEVLAGGRVSAVGLAGRPASAPSGRPQVILYGFNRGAAAVAPALRSLRAIAETPLLGLGPAETAVALRAQQAGARGYWVKGRDPETLLAAVRRVASGEEAWSIPYWASAPAAGSGPIDRWRSRLYASGLSQIEAAIADLDAQLAAQMPPLDRAVTAGHHRELRAARGLVTWLLAPRVGASEFGTMPAGDGGPTGDSWSTSADAAPTPPSSSSLTEASAPQLRLREQTADGAITLGGMQATLFESLETKLQSPLRNQTPRPLELDILREDRRRELLYQVLRSLKLLLNELRQSSIQPAQLIDQRSRLLRDLWQNVTVEFFGKYYAVSIEGVELEVVPLLLREADRVLPILEEIPGVVDLLAHLLFQNPLLVDSVPHAVGTAAAMARAEQLLDNLMVRVANAVVQPMLNQLADVEVIKQNFYTRRLLSSRDIAQFRNDLSWHYRLANALYEPLDIFESQMRLFRLGPIGVEEQRVYLPRRSELEQLTGLRFAVTLVLELRDALAPRFQALVSWVGKLVVYLLTEVLGRGIGLVGRGVLRGVGSAWQDARVSRDGPKGPSGQRR